MVMTASEFPPLRRNERQCVLVYKFRQNWSFVALHTQGCPQKFACCNDSLPRFIGRLGGISESRYSGQASPFGGQRGMPVPIYRKMRGKPVPKFRKLGTTHINTYANKQTNFISFAKTFNKQPSI